MTESMAEQIAPVRIAVVGSVNMDLVCRAQRMPQAGETVEGRSFHQIPGGKGANQAVAAARMGGTVSMIGRVGDDAFGAQLCDGLRAAGVDTAQVNAVAGASTGIAAIQVDDAGRNSIVVVPGANQALTADDVDAAAGMIRSAQLLLCQLETPLPAVARAMATARAGGVRVLFNPAPMRPLSDDVLALVDYLIVNETEAAQLSGIAVDSEETARRAGAALLARGPGAVLLTMGAQGVLVVCAAATTSNASNASNAASAAIAAFQPAVPVEAIDSTAAGDTFVGAFAVGLGSGLDVQAACAQAQYAAALSVTRLGAQSSIPERREVLAFMRSRRDAPCAMGEAA